LPPSSTPRGYIARVAQVAGTLIKPDELVDGQCLAAAGRVDTRGQQAACRFVARTGPLDERVARCLATLGESDVERFKNFTFRGSKSNNKGAVDGNEDSSEGQESDEEDDELSDDQSIEDSEDPDLDVEMDDDEDEVSDSETDPESPPSHKAKSHRDLARAELRKAATSSSSTAALASALSASAKVVRFFLQHPLQ